MQRRTMLFGAALNALAKEPNRQKAEEAAAVIARSVDKGETAAATLDVRRADFRLTRSFGLAKSMDAVFLLASVTKPMTATGLMILVDRGQVSLDAPVRKYLPEFSGGGKDRVTVKHILTHTSGLPDQLPQNVELRKRHAGLKDFYAAVCRTPLLFEPGSKVSYQSMGLLVAQEIAERITQRPFRDFLRDELFLPLGMTATSLGLGGRAIAATMPAQVASAPALYGSSDNDWNWNSPYWRDLGAPWGGGHSTAGDLERLLESFLEPTGRVMKKSTARRMINVQTGALEPAWGLGWSLGKGNFGVMCSPRTFGHYGVTGTIAWADPATGLRCVLLTTKTVDDWHGGLLGPVSNLVSEVV